MNPYIGITDFETGEQARQMLEFFDQLSPPANRRLMIGVMMSYRSLRGEPNSWSRIWPAKEKLPEIFTDHPLACNALHYADYKGRTACNDLLAAIEYGGPNLQAVQFDMIWPDPGMLAFISRQYPRLELILQVGACAFDYAAGELDELFARLDGYGNIIDCVLLDRSMGQGVGMDAALFENYVKTLRGRRPDLAVAVAGGLGPKTMDLAEPLIRQYPDLSIDAQGQLRPSGSNLDPIKWDLAREYLAQAVVMFNEYSQ